MALAWNISNYPCVRFRSIKAIKIAFLENKWNFTAAVGKKRFFIRLHAPKERGERGKINSSCLSRVARSSEYFIGNRAQKFKIFRRHRVTVQPISRSTWLACFDPVARHRFFFLWNNEASATATTGTLQRSRIRATGPINRNSRDTRINVARSRVQFSSDWFCWMPAHHCA